jgi:hypothetical protein
MHDLRLLVTGFLDTSDFCFFIAAWEALVPEADVGHKVPPSIQKHVSNDHRLGASPSSAHHVP